MKRKESTLSMYTVIGLIDSTGEVTADQLPALDAYAAMCEVAAKTGNDRSDLQIIGAIRGEHQITTPCEDSGKAAYACDIDQNEYCAECGKTLSDGEGYDGLCGSCADKAEGGNNGGRD